MIEVIFITMLFVLGASVGSFLCCLNDRLAIACQALTVQGVDSQDLPLNELLFRPSFCLACSRRLSWVEKLPIVSYILSNGRCGGCRAPIERRLLLFELILGSVLVSLFLIDGSLNSLPIFLFIGILFAAVDFDYRYLRLPDIYSYSILWLGLISSILGAISVSIDEAIYGVVFSYFSLHGIRLVFLRFKGRESLGMGDPLLAAALSAWVGVSLVPYFLLFSSLIGVVWVVLASHLAGSSVSNHAIPFAPSLAIGCMVTLLVAMV